MSEKNIPASKAEMMIRKPVAEVFEALVNPDITTKFWFTKSSGRLEEGKQIEWTWEMYNFKTEVSVKNIEKDKRIVVEWMAYGSTTTIEWIFTDLKNKTTFVSVTNYGFTGDEATILKHCIDSTEGFAFLLAGLKAWLEHGIQLNLVSDRFPKGMEN